MDSSRPVSPLRVLIADRSGGSRGSLSEMLAASDGIELVGCAQKAIETLMLVEELRPDAVLLDIEMPSDTLSFVVSLIKRQPRPPAIVVVTPYASTMLRERSLSAGADEVFARTREPERLLRILEKINAGEISRGGRV